MGSRTSVNINPYHPLCICGDNFNRDTQSDLFLAGGILDTYQWQREYRPGHRQRTGLCRFRQSAIFGVVPAHAATQTAQTAVQPSFASLASPHEITGTLRAVSGSTLTLQTRTGKSVKIDDSQAVQNEEVAPLFVGQPFTALGSSFDANGALVATSIVRANGSSGAFWPPDF